MVKFLLPLILFTACAGLPMSANRLPTAEALKPPCGTCIVPADSERLSEISRARTLVPSTKENLGHTIFEGPSRSAFVPKWNEEIRCKFVEPVAGRPMGGQTPKFNCEASIHGKAAVLRVKYQNPEILPTGRSS